MRCTTLAIIAVGLLSSAALAGCTIYPTPLTETELTTAAAVNVAQVVTDQEPISGPVTLYEAMARALKYNLDHRVEEAEAAVRKAELDLANFNLLPNIVANNG
jgi:outer membrane protein TolC